MSVVIIPRTARAVIPTHKYARNGKPVLSDLQQIIAERIGQAASWRQAEVFGACAPMFTTDGDAVVDSEIPASTSGTRTRWRFAFKAHPYAWKLWVRFYMAPPTVVSGTPYTTLKLYSDTLLTTLVGEARAYVTASGSDVPSAFVNGETMVSDWTVAPATSINLTPGAEYYAVVEDINYARCISVSVRQAALSADTTNGWPEPNVSGGASVLDADRSTVAVMARALWEGHCAKLFDWSAGVVGEARTVTGGSGYVNLITTSITAVDESSPGIFLDMRKRTTIARASKGVPVRLRVFASGTAADTGGVRVLDDTGTTLMECACAGGSARWYYTDGWLPAADAKYDLHFGGGASSLTVSAVSLYEYNHNEPVYTPPVPVTTTAAPLLLLGGPL